MFEVAPPIVPTADSEITEEANLLSLITAEAKKVFVERFSCPADVVVAAPGRVNLIGGHVDYHDGIVLPMAIDRYTVMAGTLNQSDVIRVYSQSFAEECALDLNQPLVPVDAWSDYIAGVVNEVLELDGGRQLAGRPIGFDAVIWSAVPLGMGLSSSAALEVATATLMEGLFGLELGKRNKALLCQRAEHKFAGMPCGIMDQFTSVFGETGKLLKLNCRNQDLAMLDWRSDDVKVMILNSHAPHQLVEGKYAERRKESTRALEGLGVESFADLLLPELDAKREQLEAVEFRRARHVVTEIERARKTAAMIEEGDWVGVGSQLYSSHRSLRDDYQVSCPELDLLVEIARSIPPEDGLFGMRMTGGGFGGCTVALVEAKSLLQVATVIREKFAAETGNDPIGFSTFPARGAYIIQN